MAGAKRANTVWEIVTAGGWLMLPIVACSIVALAIVGERFFTLRSEKVLPKNLVADVWRMASTRQLTEDKVREIQQGSPLGRVLGAGLLNRSHDREVMKASIEEVGGHVAHELGRYLNALGTIAAVTPLLGLLGTVVGMISVFTNITTVGVGNPAQLAGGISQALITTAGGLMVAIPTLMFHRYFRGKVDGLVVDMEKESLKLVDVLQKRQAQARVAHS
jgi:biopolymer transport protein ExbB